MNDDYPDDLPGDIEGPTMPKIEHTPHYKYPDWPGTTKIRFEEGIAELQNSYDGSELFVRVGDDSLSPRAALKLHEAMILRDHLDYAIQEQERLLKEYGDEDEELQARDVGLPYNT
jgi:hypothetical protein